MVSGSIATWLPDSDRTGTVGFTFDQPLSLALDGKANLYIADRGRQQIYQLVPPYNGTPSVFHSIGGSSADYPSVAADAAGNVYYTDSNAAAVTEVIPANGNSTHLWGAGPNAPMSLSIDAHGTLYIADVGHYRLLKVATRVNFGAVAVGSPSAVTSLTFTLPAGGSIGAPAVLTQGAAMKDFQDAGTGTCTTNGPNYTYNPGDTCTVDVTFAPRYPGNKSGAVVLFDNLGNTLVTAYVHGSGVGPAVSFTPPTVGVIANSTPAGQYPMTSVAVDGNGIVYFGIGDGLGVLYRAVPSNSGYSLEVVKTWGSSTREAYTSALAVDGRGNIYAVMGWTFNLGEGNYCQVVKETPVPGGYVESPVANPSNGQCNGVAVDNEGNVYVSDLDHNRVVKETLIDGDYVESVVPTSSMNTPWGVAVDSTGAIYISDDRNSRVLKETPTPGGYLESVVVSDLQYPEGIAVDGLGNIFVGDFADWGLMKGTPTEGAYTWSLVYRAYGLATWGIAVDEAGSVYDAAIWIPNPYSYSILKIDYANPPSLDFNTTGAGQTSSDSPRIVTVANTGNAPLIFAAPDSGSNPSVSANFIWDGSTSTCEQTPSGSLSPFTLAEGATCTIGVDFAPITSGSISGNVLLTDNGPSSPQTISLSGTASVPPSVTPTITWTAPAPIPYGTALSAMQLDAISSVPGTFSYNPTFGAVLGAGSHVLTANFTPTDTTHYTTATSTVTLVVNPATPIITWAAPASIAYGTALSTAQFNASATYGGVTVNGSYVYTTGSSVLNSGMVLNAGTYLLSVTFTPADTNLSPQTTTNSIIVTPQPQTITFNPASPVAYGLAPITLTATGGASGNPVTYLLISGPGSLSAADHSVLTVTGVGTIQVEACQAGSAPPSTNFSAAPCVTKSILVNQTLSVACSAVNTGTVGVAFNSGPITVTGGTAPYTFSFVGTLPAGLTLNASTGAINGTPTASGTFSVKVADANGVVGATTCSITIAAQTGGSCTLEVANAYNLISLTGNISDAADITGRIAAAGKITEATTIGDALRTSDPYFSLAKENGGPFAIVAGGGIPTGNSFNINAGGNVYSSTSTNANFNFANENYSGSLYAGSTLVTGGPSPIDFSALQTQMYTLSGQLTGLASNGVVCSVNNSGSIVAGGGCPSNPIFFNPNSQHYNPSWIVLYGTSTTTNIFNITQAEFQDNNNLDIEVPTGSTAIINVAGTSDTLQRDIYFQGNTVTDANASNLLFNFATATSVTIDGQIFATVLAPYASLTGGSQMGGVFIAASIGSTGQVHYDAFGGTLPNGMCSNIPAPLSVSCAAVNTGTVGVGFNSGPMTVTGGMAPYIFSVNAGTLPAGLTLNTSTGAVTGTPTASGTFSVMVTDPNGATGTACAITINQAQTSTPTFSPAGGTYTTTQTVTITDATALATIYYTTNGTTPTTGSTVYSGPIAINMTENIEAIAVATGYSTSGVATATYTITQSAINAFLAPSSLSFVNQSVGVTSNAQLVTLDNSSNGAMAISSIGILGTNASSFSQTNNCGTTLAGNSTCTIWVTFTPATTGSFSATFSVTDNATGSPQTIPLTGNATHGPQTITFTQPASPVTYGASPITLSATATSGLAVSFGLVSGPGTISGSTLTISGAGTVIVAANQAGNSSYSAATQVTRTIVVNQATPIIALASSPNPTLLQGAITLTATATGVNTGVPTGIVTFSAGSTVLGIRSLNASGIASLATSALPVGTTTIAAAYGGDTNFVSGTSNTVSQVVTTPSPTATPTFSPAAGTYIAAQTVTISDATAGATVYYTTDGTTPTTSSNPYTGAITVSSTETLQAIAIGSGFSTSAVATVAYTITRQASNGAGEWTWMSGSNIASDLGSSGTKNVPDAANLPRSRASSVSWRDKDGNLWLFGGFSSSENFNDMWEFTPKTGMWTWVSGGSQPSYGMLNVPDPANLPEARVGAVSWVDSNGYLWLFGGERQDSTGTTTHVLNDLWKYDPTKNLWTWESGANTPNQQGINGTKGVPDVANVPGARSHAISWIDGNDNLWLFGGWITYGVSYEMIDLWKFDPRSSEWTWVDGINPVAGLFKTPVYGTKGVPGTANYPGPRGNAVSWTDSSGNFWLFGGSGWSDPNTRGSLNDFWKYDPVNNLWTWMSGADTANQQGVYGTQGVSADTNVPGPTTDSVSWRDSNGNLWLFGGYGWDPIGNYNSLNELWKYNIKAKTWTWVSGASSAPMPGVYGTKGIPAAANVPGGRNAAIGWTDSNGDLWLFGGNGDDSTGQLGTLNDLWRYQLSSSSTATPTSTTLTASLNPSIFGQAVTITAAVTATSGSTVPTGTVQFSVDGSPAGSTVTLGNGTATYTTSSFAIGTHSITAAYAPDSGCLFAASNAAILSQVVSQAVAATPVFAPASGTFTSAQTVTITDATAGATIYYTTDGTTPTTSSTPYTGAISVFSTEAINSIATASGYANSSVATASYTIHLPVAPSITWAIPAAISYGTALSSNQLDATASVPGSYTYSPAAGTVLPAGQRTLSVTFTPTDTTNYTTATASVSLVVNLVTPTLTLTPSTTSITTAQPLTVTVAVSGENGGPTPTGSVTLVGGGYSAQQTLASGSATFNLAAGTLSVGGDTLTAAYVPDFSSAIGYVSSAQSVVVTVTTPAGSPTPAVTVTPSATTITDQQSVSVTVSVSGGSGQATPSGTVTLSSGSYSAQQTLASGSTIFTITAGTLSSGNNTFTATYEGNGAYSSFSGTTTVTVSAVSILVSAPAGVIPGASVSTTTTLTAGSTYSGTMNLSCTLTSSPIVAVHLPTCSLSPSTLTIASSQSGTTTLTVKTTADTTTADARPFGKNLWGLGSGGSALAAVLMLGIPRRRRRWLLMVFLSLIVAAGATGCGVSFIPRLTPNVSTTAGNYSFTVTGKDTSNTKIITSTNFSVTVQ
jgi:choice-of-anchor A domain-containing protein